MLEIRALTSDIWADLERLFGAHRVTNSCWCMWFIIRVKEFHENGASVNAAKLRALAENSAHPLGLIAYRDGGPVGWIAAGPRSRYARAIHTPTLKGLDHAENDDVWLIPCFFVRPDMRGNGVAQSLLREAVALASAAGAKAVEGFPTPGSKRVSTDSQVGTEYMFKACGFEAVHRPSSNRVVMRLALSVSN